MNKIQICFSQSPQRKIRYTDDQNCEKAQFWSHFMPPCRAEAKFYPQGVDERKRICFYEERRPK